MTIELNPDKCNMIVFEHGRSLGFFALRNKAEANEFCQKKNESEPDVIYDWHFVGGRTHIKYLSKDEYLQLLNKQESQT